MDATLQSLFDLLGPVDPGARLVAGHGQASRAVRRVHTDTRSLRPGDLFVALQGDRFDAREFLPQAAQAGAAAALVSGESGVLGLGASGLPGIVVNDSLKSLGLLAQAWRARSAIPLIAVTGSNGKTTVTQMIAAMLRAEVGDAALATQGNLNNAIGVPLTLLRLEPAHRLAVVEMGMNHAGEIAQLARMAQPTVAVVNNAQREHLEFMGSVDAVARENGSVIAALPVDGAAVFPADDAYASLWRGVAAGRRTCTFSDVAEADVRLEDAVWDGGAWALRMRTPLGIVATRAAIAGRHNLRNALAATACALAAGVSRQAVAQGLADFLPVKGRSRAVVLHVDGRELTLVDDSYNANPDSVRAAIDVLAALPGPRLLVLGDMGEVGDQGPAFHAEAGTYAASLGIEQVLCLGELSAYAAAACAGARHVSDVDALLAAVDASVTDSRSVLVKGSRFMRMERVVEHLAARALSSSKEAPCS
ncbi:MAG TPA: UDP-N-acetylmuramoyl-tripeptide--D-alanyl-D-alanine ligase [Burkholderiaceae bacterium]|nr:UDP-N-acetylmuramoyl-tripeptide--D-alanyl-D-alanine ligase [Burkholderiaceae bacterium]